MKSIRKLFCLLLAAVSVFTAIPVLASQDSGEEASPSTLSQWPEGPALQAEAGLLMDARTGTVLFSKHGEQRMYPASITKLMTALLVLENCSLDETVTFSHAAVYSIEADSSHIGVQEGEELTVEQCLYALLLKSANEVANGLAEHVAGSMSAFAEMMNNRAAQLGCTDTHFINANGLHDENHYTTAHDMARIMQALVDNETFTAISSADNYQIPPTNKTAETRYLKQTHKMMCESDYTYEGTVSGKTGFTPEAGNTLVTYAKRGDLELIAVSLKSNWKHYDDTIAMFNYGFEHFSASDMSGSAAALEAVREAVLAQAALDPGTGTLSLNSDNWAVLPDGITADSLNAAVTLFPASQQASMDSTTIGTVAYRYNGVRLGTGTVSFSPSASSDSKTHETTPETLSGPDTPTVKRSRSGFPVWLLVILIPVVLILLILLILYLRNRSSRNRRANRISQTKLAYKKRRRGTRHYLSKKDSYIDRK